MATAVVLLGEPDRRAMTRTQSRLTSGFTDSGRKHAAAATRSPCTMTAPSCSGEPGWKIVDQQVVGHHRIQRNAALDVVPHPDLAFDDDDRTGVPRRQRRRRHDELLDRFVVLVARSK